MIPVPVSIEVGWRPGGRICPRLYNTGGTGRGGAEAGFVWGASVCPPRSPGRSRQGHLVGWARRLHVHKRLERGRYVWPAAKEREVALTPAQLSMLLEGIDWRAPERT